MDLTANNGIVNDLVELALKVPSKAEPPLARNAVYVFLRDLGDVARAVLTAVRDNNAAFARGGSGAPGTPIGAQGAKDGKRHAQSEQTP